MNMRVILLFTVLIGTSFIIDCELESTLFRYENYSVPKDVDISIGDIDNAFHIDVLNVIKTEAKYFQKIDAHLHKALSGVDFINQWSEEKAVQTFTTKDKGEVTLRTDKKEFINEFAQNHYMLLAKLNSDIHDNVLIVLVSNKDQIEYNRQMYLLVLDNRSCITAIAEVAYSYNIDGEILHQSTSHVERGCFASFYSMSEEQIEFCITPSGYFASVY